MSFNNNSSTLMNSLICRKCKNSLISPVYSCVGGHMFCGLCQIGSENCVCGEPLLPFRYAETLLKSINSTLPCRNVQAGCTHMLRAWEMKEHLETCEFGMYHNLNRVNFSMYWYQSRREFDVDHRAIKCYEMTGRRIEDCKLWSLDSFLTHLIEDHYCFNLRFDNEDLSLPIQYDIFYKSTEIHFDGFWRGPTNYLEFDNRTFLFNSATDSGAIYRWMTLVGNETDATEYRFKLLFEGKDDPAAPKFEWELPVHSVWHCDFEKAKETGDVAILQNSAIEPYAKKGVVEREGNRRKKYDYIWCVEIKMIKL